MSLPSKKQEWVKKNVVLLHSYDTYNPFNRKFDYLMIKLMTVDELKTVFLDNENFFYEDYFIPYSSSDFPRNAKIVITQYVSDKNKIYHEQYYDQGNLIKDLDINVMPSGNDRPDSVNLVIHRHNISNLQYYDDIPGSLNYNLYMYNLKSSSEDGFSQFISDHKNNIMKFTNINLLNISRSYFLVKYLCNKDNTTGQKIYVHIYSYDDIYTLNKLFENEKNIKIGENVTIILSFGWIIDPSIESLFLQYMNLMVHMTEYKMRHGTIQFKIDASKLNKEKLSKNNSYFECVQVLFDEYIIKKKPNAKNYRACLLAVQNLKRLNSTLEEIKQINNNFKSIETKINEVGNRMTTYYSTKASLDTKYTTLDEKIDQQMDKKELTEELRNLELSLNKQMTQDYSDISERLNNSISDLNDRIFKNSNERDTAFSKSLQELYGQFLKMENDNKYRFNLFYLYLFVLVSFVLYIFTISVRTSIKKK